MLLTSYIEKLIGLQDIEMENNLTLNSEVNIKLKVCCSLFLVRIL